MHTKVLSRAKHVLVYTQMDTISKVYINVQKISDSCLIYENMTSRHWYKSYVLEFV